MKQNKRQRWPYWLTTSLAAFLLLGAVVFTLDTAVAAPPPPVQTVYDGSLGTLPASQGMSYAVFDSSNPFDVQTTQSYDGRGARLDSSADVVEYAGYSSSSTTLDRQQGFTIRFSVQITSEDHTTSGTADKNNDGIADRAGFSVIAISSDGQYGIELGFWEDEIWAQEGGTDPLLFTHAEAVSFTTTSVVTYDLAFLGDSYSLMVQGTPILTGSLRDYSAFSGTLDPYETPNLLFFGDDTTSAGAEISLSHISILPTITVQRCGLSDGQSLDFGLAETRIEVDTAGSLSCITATRVSGDHPGATAAISSSSDLYWQVTSSGAGFTVDLSFPDAGVSGAPLRSCRTADGGASWDCLEDSDGLVGNGWIERQNVTTFSEWQMCGGCGPTSLSSSQVTVTAERAGPGVALLVLLAFSIVTLFRGHRIRS